MSSFAERCDKRWGMSSLLRPVLIFIACGAQLGCYYHDDEGKGYQGPVSPKPYVYVSDYRVTNVATGATYASGCSASPYFDCVGCTIIANVPYGVDYMLELTNFRHIDGDMSDQDAGFYCEAFYGSQVISHRNPTCYRTYLNRKNAELLDASVVDSSGNPLASTDTRIIGTSTDIERFTIRSSSWGSVWVSLAGPPCNDTSTAITTLLTIPAP